MAGRKESSFLFSVRILPASLTVLIGGATIYVRVVMVFIFFFRTEIFFLLFPAFSIVETCFESSISGPRMRSYDPLAMLLLLLLSLSMGGTSLHIGECSFFTKGT
jgi:hypothetical protein